MLKLSEQQGCIIDLLESFGFTVRRAYKVNSSKKPSVRNSAVYYLVHCSGLSAKVGSRKVSLYDYCLQDRYGIGFFSVADKAGIIRLLKSHGITETVNYELVDFYNEFYEYCELYT